MKVHSLITQRSGTTLRQVVAGLLLSATVILPITGFGQGVIAISVFTGIDLNVTFPVYNSATVLPGVIVSAGAGTNGITGSTHTWDVTVGAANNPIGATVNGGASGIELLAGGTVTNNANSSIAGGTGEGVHITGGTAGTAVVDNSGSISGGSPSGNDGVDMDNGGTIINRTNATIYGNDDGISAHGTVSVLNHGDITGLDDGVNLHDSGTLNNSGTIIGGDNGVEFNSGSGSVINTGSITAQNNGVLIEIGTVENQTNAVISGSTGVYVNDTGFVWNAGSITGTNGNGVYIENVGRVDNKATGTITGSQNGVQVNFPGWVTNAGTITGNGGEGVLISHGDDGTIVNFAGAVIYGSNSGVIVEGTGTVENGGSITGAGDDGVHFDDGGSVNNLVGGSITGDDSGVEVFNSSGSVVNAGSITGNGRHGVEMHAGGTVNNLTGGSITGDDDGVRITGGTADAASVDNDGNITGNGRHGVHLNNGGSVNNTLNGVIQGDNNGVRITGGTAGLASVINAGSISSTGGDDAIDLDNGGSVNNSGFVSGGDDGVVINNAAGSVINTGTITGANNNGVHMTVGGVVDNQSGGTIGGSDKSIRITGGAATVLNSGTLNGAVLLSSSDDTMTLDSGSVINGNVDAAGGNDGLILHGIGNEDNNFLNFEYLSVNSSVGDWTLTGNNTFTTGVDVIWGRLAIGAGGVGSLVTPLVIISADGTLGGSGTIVGDIDNSHGGVLAPGNSIGTLTVIGSVTNNGDYHVEVNAAGASDNLLISSNLLIGGGDVVVSPSNGLYSAVTTYSILTASNGISGAFNSVYVTNHTLFISLDPSLQYIGGTNLQLTLVRESFASVAKTHNQKAVAGSLDGLIDPIIGGANAGFSNTINTLFEFSNTNSFLAALDSLSGEVHGTLGMAAVQQHDAFVQSVALRTGRITSGGDGGYASAKRMQLAANGTMPAMEADTQKPWELWAGGYGSWADFDSDGNAAGGDFDIWGFNGGLDYTVSPELLLGFALGYSHNNLNTSRGSGEIDALQFAGYGSFVHGPWHFDGVASYGHLNNETKRGIFDGSTAKAKYDGNIFGISVEGGYAFEAGPITIQPTIGIKYTHLGQDSFREKGAGAAGLDVSDVEMDSIRASGGVRLTGHFGHKIQFIPEIRAAWEHEFADRTADVNAEFIGDTATSASFTSRGLEIGADSGVVGAGFKVAFNKTIAVFANYNARINEQFTSQTVSGGLSVGW